MEFILFYEEFEDDWKFLGWCVKDVYIYYFMYGRVCIWEFVDGIDCIWVFVNFIFLGFWNKFFIVNVGW